MAKDLLLGRCLVKGMSKSLREKIQVLRWGTSSAGGPSHCFYSLCRCVSRSLREKNSGFALGDVFGRKAMPECQGCLAKDLLLEGCLVKVTSRTCSKKTGLALGDVFGLMAFSLFLFFMPACL